jgi:hypothetical protein
MRRLEQLSDYAALRLIQLTELRRISTTMKHLPVAYVRANLTLMAIVATPEDER